MDGRRRIAAARRDHLGRFTHGPLVIRFGDPTVAVLRRRTPRPPARWLRPVPIAAHVVAAFGTHLRTYGCIRSMAADRHPPHRPAAPHAFVLDHHARGDAGLTSLCGPRSRSPRWELLDYDPTWPPCRACAHAWACGRHLVAVA